MFDIGFSELLLIAVVALVVLGPERLPKAARFAGLWVRRARAQWASVKSELERDLAAEDLKREFRDTQASMRQAQASLREAGHQAQLEFDTVHDGLMRGPPLPASDADADADAQHESAPSDSTLHDPETSVAAPVAALPAQQSVVASPEGMPAPQPDAESKAVADRKDGDVRH